MFASRILLCAVFSTFAPVISLHAASYRPTSALPPEPEREFRGAWVATVKNIDWPSRPGLSTAEQKTELLAILDRAVQLKLNAVIFQVRPQCDALYASSIEPWSEFLTGTMGKAPEPFYDPLTFAVEAAHKRGLELHAWFNPYRALDESIKSPVAANHITKTRPDLVRKYGGYRWLDPGEPDVQIRSLRVVMDVVNRYDIDAVHFDDYFYPYQTPNPRGGDPDFPDDATWKKFGVGTGLSRDDWRRENVNTFIQHVQESVHAAKPWVKLGISPFGIWRPGFPAQIRGKDAYSEIFADSRKWLNNGWLDYCAPQLYWEIDPKAQSFPALLGWWAQQNTRGRHLWAGMNSTKWSADEIIRQIQITRRQPGCTGHIHWDMKSLMNNTALDGALQREVYTATALVPASPWLDAVLPGKPVLTVLTNGYSGAQVHWQANGSKVVRWWLLQFQKAGSWTTEILPANRNSRSFEGYDPKIIAVRAVDRVGNLSAPAAVTVIQQLSVPGNVMKPAPQKKNTTTRRKPLKINTPKDAGN